MTAILRNHAEAEHPSYDLIIIGAGVYGISLSLVASRMGLKVLLLEKKDFGWSTSFNSLRTIHGGLRYLQKMDLKRFFESVAERQWFLREFPGLVTPLPCLMPLYGNGMYRPSVFRVALALNDMLSCNRNRGVATGQELENGRIINSEEVIRIFPLVDRTSLQGGAVWHDGGMPASQLVVMEMLKQACRGDVTPLNYTEATELILDNNQVRGIRCIDSETGKQFEFKGTRVINAAGPWCRKLATSFDRDDPELFRYSIAWNVLINKKALSSHSLAVKPKRPGARMFFVHAWNGLILGGTVHSPWHDTDEYPMPGEKDLQAYIDDMNLAIPSLNLKQSDILQIYSGLLPVREQGTDILADREVIKDHGTENGPRGLFTVSGVKFTTSRKVAEKALKIIFPGRAAQAAGKRGKTPVPVPSPASLESIFDFHWQPGRDGSDWQERLTGIIRNEAVVHLDDLMIRRTTLGDNPQRAMTIAPEIVQLFDWDPARQEKEIERLHTYFAVRRPR
jgi:glycerol-3-phosphate dehydrogenase